MFALDLFNNDHERRLAEGAVDQLEQRRIDDLAMKMDDLVARAFTPTTTAEVKQALMKEFQKCKDERDSYFKIKDECMGYGSLGEAGLPDVADKKTKMARVTPADAISRDVANKDYLTTAGKSQGPVGKAVATGKEAVKWLAGRGGPGQEGPTYESELNEQFGAVGSKGLMNGNFATFMKARQNKTPVTLEIGGEEFRLTPTMMDAMAKKYAADKAASDADPTNRDIKLIAVNNYRAFGYPQLMRAFIDGVATTDPTPPANVPGEQLPMFERTQPVQKKNSKEPELDSTTASDATVQRELQKMRARHPAARSDIEALVKDEIVQQEKNQQDIDQLHAVNSQQDAQLNKVSALNQQQEKEVTGLDQEIARLDGKLNQVLGTPVPKVIQPTTVAEPVKAKSATTAIPTTPSLSPMFAPTAEPVADKSAAEIARLDNEIGKLNTAFALKTPAQQDDLRDRIDALEKERNAKIEKQKATTAKAVTTRAKNKQQAPGKQAPALSDPNVVDIDAWEVPRMAVPDNIENEPVATTPTPNQQYTDATVDRPTTIPFAGGTKNTKWGPGGKYTASTARPLPGTRGHHLGLTSRDEEDVAPEKIKTFPRQTEPMKEDKMKLLARSLEEDQQLHVGDPIVVTAPNEFEGKTGEIYDFAPSGKFVIVNLYNHGKHSMHLSDVEYNQYADDEDADEYGEHEHDELDEEQLAEATYRDVIYSLLDKFYADMKMPPRQNSHSGELSIKPPGTRVWTRGDGTRHRDPGYITANYFADDKKRAEKLATMFWPWLLKQPGIKSIGQVSGEFGSSPMKDAVAYKGLYFTNNNGYATSFGSLSRIKNPKSVWRHKPLELEPKAEQGVAETADPQRAKAGKIINRCFGKISEYEDDGWEYLDRNAPVWYNLFNDDQYDGDIDVIIANAPIDLLVTSAQEMMDVVSDLPYELEEGWSNKMVARRTGQLPTPYSVFIKGKEWKSFADDDHAEAVANKLRAKFEAEGRDPSVITIAPTGYDKTEEAYTPAPVKPFRSPRGFNKQGTGLGNKLADLNRKEWEEKKKKEQGVAEDIGFAPGNGGDDNNDVDPRLVKMAHDAGVVKGYSLADAATLTRAMAIDEWDTYNNGIYKQYFADGFKKGRLENIRHGNEHYNLNLKLMKDA